MNNKNTPVVNNHRAASLSAFRAQPHTQSSRALITEGALVDVLVAGRAGIAWRAGADGHAVDGIGVTVGAFLTRVTDARVIQMTQQTCK